jgi:DNA-binding XRE family transcriptional regulator
MTMTMTAEQYRSTRASLGLTQAELAELLGVSRDTIIRRESGESQITREIEVAIRLLAEKTGARR